jgi:hypothetical protein
MADSYVGTVGAVHQNSSGKNYFDFFEAYY